MSRLLQYLAVGAVVPPFAASMFWLMGTGWMAFVYGGKITPRGRQMRRIGFRIVLFGAYGLVLIEGFIFHVF